MSKRHAPAVTAARGIVNDWFDSKDTVKLRARIGEREWTYRMVLAGVRKGLSMKPGKVDPELAAEPVAISQDDVVAAVVMDSVKRIARLEAVLTRFHEGKINGADIIEILNSPDIADVVHDARVTITMNNRMERLENAIRTLLDGTPNAADDALKLLDGKR